MTLVSIIIPVFNASLFLKETVNSCLSQQGDFDVEIILIDDHSGDDSWIIMQNIQENNRNVVRIYKNDGKGANRARNYGFKLSKGDYIQNLDADDLLGEDKIANQLNILKSSSQYSLSFTGWTKFYKTTKNLTIHKQAINKSYDKPYQWLLDSWNGGGMAIPAVWLMSRELAQKSGFWNESLTVNQDGEYFSRVILNSDRILFEEKSIVYYRFGNPNSTSQRKDSIEKCQSLLDSFKMYELNISAYADKSEVKKALANNYLKFLYNYDRSIPSLSERAWNNFYALEVGEPWCVGGGLFKSMCKVIGFKKSLMLIKTKNRLLKQKHHTL